MHFAQVRLSDLSAVDKIWENLRCACGSYAFIQCDKSGKHKPFKEIKNVWLPMEIIKRFSEGKPTQIFFFKRVSKSS